MENRTTTLVRAARADGRLAAVHIDLQTCFYGPPTARAFDGVRGTAASLRRADIPNIWVVFNDRPACSTKEPLLAGHYDRHSWNSGLHPSAGALPCEAVIVKDRPSALPPGGSSLAAYLSTIGADTLLVDGVFARQCVAETLRDAVLTDRYNVVAVADGMDWTNHKSRRDYPALIERSTKESALTRRRLSMTTSAVIKHAILTP